MIRHVQHALALSLVQSIRSAHCARESRIRRRIRRLPHIIKLPEDVRYGIGIEIVVYEEDDAFPADDELTQRGPVFERHGGFGRLVDILLESGVFDRGNVVLGCYEGVAVVVFELVVAIADEDGDYVEGVCTDPICYRGEIVFDGAGVEKVA